MPKGHRKYNGTQKVESIERIRSEQLSFHEASKEYDIPRQTLQDWETDLYRLLKKIESLNSGRGTPKQKAQVVQELRQKYPLKPLLQLAKLPRSTFYYYFASV